MVRATRSAPSTPPTRTMPSRGAKTPEPLSAKDEEPLAENTGRRRSMRGAAQQALENFRAPALLKQEQARIRKEEKETRAAIKASKVTKGSPTKKNTKPKSLMPAKALNSDAEDSESEESEESEESLSDDDPEDDEGKLELLQGLWEIPYICHFLWMYQSILAVKPVSPEELERAFLSLDGSSPILSEIHSKLLLSSKREREVFHTEPEREGYPTLVWQSLVRRKLADWVEVLRRVEDLEEQVENEEDSDEEDEDNDANKEDKVDYDALLEEAERELHELPELFFLRGVNPLQGEESEEEEEEEEEEGNHVDDVAVNDAAPTADTDAKPEVKTEEVNGGADPGVKAEDGVLAQPKEQVNGVGDAPMSEEVKAEKEEEKRPKKVKKEKPFVEDTPSVLAAKKALVALNLPREMEDAALKVAGLYEKMHLAKKVRVLKCLCDWRASDEEFKEELKSIEIEDQRVKPIGKDGSRCEYYHFGFKDNRIYKLTPSTKKQPEQWTLEFKGGQDLGEIKNFTKELKNKKNPRDRALYETFTMLMEELEEEAERMRQEEERKEKERQRQEYLDSLPRRRSSRVENKAVLNAEQRREEEERARAKAEKEAMIRLQRLQRMAIVEIKKAKGDIEADAAVHEVIEEEDYKQEKVVLSKKKQKALEKRRQTELLKKLEDEEAERAAEQERQKRAMLREERALKRKVGEEEFQRMVERGEIIPYEVQIAKTSKTDENEVVDVDGDTSKPAAKSSSKKRKAATAGPAAPPQRDLSDYKKENWVQCERCEKWRRVVDWVAIPDDMEFYCEKNYWDNFNSCDALEETEPVPVVQAPAPKKQKATPKKPKSPTPKKAQAAAKVITDRYVMCEKCEEWIIVPPNHNIDESVDWECSMNTWDPNLRCKVADLPAPIPMAEPMDSSSEESAPEEGQAPKTPITPGAARPDLLSGNWVQCEECDKWREVPAGVLIPPTVSWECSMNDWGDGYNTCDAPQASFKAAV